MRILLTTLGSFGDVNPFLWMGRVFRDRGHEVIFIANPYFEERIRKEGFPFHGVGTLEDYEQAALPAVRTGKGFRDQGELIQASRRLFQFMFLKPTRDIYETICSLKNSETVVFHHFYAYGARLVAEKYGIPQRNVCLSPYWLKSFRKNDSLSAFLGGLILRGTTGFVDGQLFTRPMNEIRGEIGLPPLGKSSLEWMFDGRNVCLFPEWLLDYGLTDSIHADFIGFPEPAAGGGTLPDEVAGFLEKNGKPLVFTPGTAHREAKEFFDSALHALKEMKKPGIFLTRHRDTIPADLPPNVLWLDYIPLELLLEHCSALVHHGGIGTCCQSLRAGIPQLICHRMGEQLENGRIPGKMGICRSISYRDLNGERMTRELKLLLEDPSVTEKCKEPRSRILEGNPEERLLKQLELPEAREIPFQYDTHLSGSLR